MAVAAEELPPEQDLSEPLMDLANLGRTVDGSGFAYLSLSCVNKRINPIKAIEGYTNLQNIDLSLNAIKDVTPLKGLPFVLNLDLSSNEIMSIKAWEEGTMPHLVNLNMSNNALVALLPLPFPALRSASFARNDIATCAEFTGHEALTSLDLSENKLTAAGGIANMPKLINLSLAGGIRKENTTNQLESFEGLTGLEALETFSVARNKLSNLAGVGELFPNLQAFDVSENFIEDNREKPLESPLNVLRQLPKLRNLACAGNPFMAPEEPPEDFNARTELLIKHWRLESIDGKAVTAEEREAARQLNVQLLEAERARKRKEEEDAKAEEEGS
jgi:Leucine-rich repeat (LRR) protein